jgi:4-amino-4-deoxychorismate lyase
MTSYPQARRALLGSALAVGTLPLQSFGQTQPIAGHTSARRAIGWIDGSPATAEQLRSVALVNYGHFSTLQVQGQSVRGLDFQIARLQRSTRELFNEELPAERIIRNLRSALDGNTGRVLARVNIFPASLDWMNLSKRTPVALLVTQSPLELPARRPQRVKTLFHERVQPHVKHVGTYGLFQARREAQRLGFDDALFFDRAASISEGSTWNVAFHDGERFVLPTAAALPGGAIHLLRNGMRKLGIQFIEADVKVAEVPRFRSAFLTNIPAVYQPITQIDGHRFEFPQDLHTTLEACYAANPIETI